MNESMNKKKRQKHRQRQREGERARRGEGEKERGKRRKEVEERRRDKRMEGWGGKMETLMRKSSQELTFPPAERVNQNNTF